MMTTSDGDPNHGDPYADLLARSRQHALLVSCAALLSWDEEVLMPRGGAEHRAAQLGLRAGMAHERAIDPRIAEILDLVERGSADLDPDADRAVNVREIRRRYDRAARVPRDLVEEIVKTTAIGQGVWRDAYKRSDYAAFAPWLAKIVALKRRAAEALRQGDETLYDALLDGYEPGARAADIARLFDALRAALVPLVDGVAEASAASGPSPLSRSYDVERQKQLCATMAAAVGFGGDDGRIDVSVHPFMVRIGPGDCRITSRYDPQDLSESVFTVLHEVGHALYEQGLDAARFGTPLGDVASIGIHESQSRLWENAIGRSRPFWQHFLPIARRLFPESLGDVDLDTFHRAVHRVARSAKRVQADELTYNLHIMLRFDLERALIAGDLEVADLPAAWNEKHRELIGLTPASDREGCLQDSHWGSGLFGYFPAYALGNVFAAQIWAALRADVGDVDDAIARGDFGGVLHWLRQRIHRHGRRYSPARLIETATGSPPSATALIASLEERYRAIYGL